MTTGTSFQTIWTVTNRHSRRCWPKCAVKVPMTWLTVSQPLKSANTLTATITATGLSL